VIGDCHDRLAAVQRTSGITAWRAGMQTQTSPARSVVAVVPRTGHRVGQGFKGAVQPTRTLEAKQQPAELVLQGEHPLDGTEPFCEDGRVGQGGLRPRRGRLRPCEFRLMSPSGARLLRLDPHDPGVFLFTVSRAADANAHMPFMRTCSADARHLYRFFADRYVFLHSVNTALTIRRFFDRVRPLRLHTPPDIASRPSGHRPCGGRALRRDATSDG